MEEAFRVEVVKMIGEGNPPCFQHEGALKGLTRNLFRPRKNILVAVMRKPPGAIPNSAAAYFHCEEVILQQLQRAVQSALV